MIHTERGKLTEITDMLIQDRRYVAETLGMGPSGDKSRDRTILPGSPREAKFLKRLDNLNTLIELLWSMR